MIEQDLNAKFMEITAGVELETPDELLAQPLYSQQIMDAARETAILKTLIYGVEKIDPEEVEVALSKHGFNSEDLPTVLLAAEEVIKAMGMINHD